MVEIQRKRGRPRTREKAGLLCCYVCHEYKPPEAFYRDAGSIYGRGPECRACRSTLPRYKQYQHNYYLRKKQRMRVIILKEVAEFLEQHPEELRYDSHWLFIARLKAGMLP